MSHRHIKREIIIGMLIAWCMAVLIEITILSFSNRKQVHRTSQIMLDQVENILDENEKNEEEILEELKVEYVERAQVVAYILEEKGVELKGDELIRLAEMMGIDEINIFDANGYIYAGTHPQYYGLSFDSGEQIAFFKPMLENKNKVMCQDITPNTAEKKSMMYAMTWNDAQTYMVQIGIEPVRLINAMRENSIHEVVSKMPVYEGMNIYVADIASGLILGSTDKAKVDMNIYECKILSTSDNIRTIKEKEFTIDGYKNYCNYRQHGNQIIAVIHSTKANVENFIIAILIEIVWLLVAGGVIMFTLFKLVNANKRIKDQMSVLSSISDIYYSMHLIDLANLGIHKLEGNALMDKVVSEGKNAADMLERIIRTTIEEEYLEESLGFADLSTIKERLKGKQSIFMDAIDKNVGWLRITFISVEVDNEKKPTKVIIATQVIDEEKKREEELSTKANRDELTGLYNRRAYEDDMLIYPDVPPEVDFVYAAIDINGLKNVNDNLGHAAGDEIIKGAAECLKRTLGNYGKVYRTGGDEFVSMFFADEMHFHDVAVDLDKKTLEWKGELVDSLSLSVGYVAKREFTTETVAEMSKIADKRMYQAKAEYYSKKGVDRRGQAAAHTALCNLYTKILKINITKDEYAIINMDQAEQTTDKGFSTKISEWLSGFGTSGQVHEDDLDEYLTRTDLAFLSDYFKQGKTSISIFYRRKFEDGYKQVVMEMIPADNYKDDDQNLFLYVKTIDK